MLLRRMPDASSAGADEEKGSRGKKTKEAGFPPRQLCLHVPEKFRQAVREGEPGERVCNIRPRRRLYFPPREKIAWSRFRRRRLRNDEVRRKPGVLPPPLPPPLFRFPPMAGNRLCRRFRKEFLPRPVRGGGWGDGDAPCVRVARIPVPPLPHCCRRGGRERIFPVGIPFCRFFPLPWRAGGSSGNFPAVFGEVRSAGPSSRP